MHKSTILILAGGLTVAAACKSTKKETAGGSVTQTPTTEIAAPAKPEMTRLNYPETKKTDQTDVYHGVTVADPYRWLEDDHSAETADWVKRQNALTFGYLEKIPMRNKIKDRLTQIWNYPKYSAPFRKGNKYYFYKNNGLQNQSILYVQNSPEATNTAEVFLDPNKLSDDGTTSLSGLSFSKDNKYVAYGTSGGGSDWNTYYVMETATKKKLADEINWVKFSGASWFKNGFFYSRYDAPKEGSELSNKNEFHKVVAPLT